jgi:preprotein translocase subunit YajC
VDILSILIFILPLALLYIFLVLPQKRRMNEHKSLLAGVEPGDEVMTTAGLYGRVVELSDDNMYLQVAPGVELRFARGAIARKVSSGELEEFDEEENEELEDDELLDDEADLDAGVAELEPTTDSAPDDGRENPAR